MSNSKWGAKRQCQECGARFYDLNRTKAVCPKCDAPFKLEPQPKAKRAVATAAKAEEAPPIEEKIEKIVVAEESAEDKALKEFGVDMPADASLDADEDEDEDENSFEDVSELGEDEDDMAEVIEGRRKIEESG